MSDIVCSQIVEINQSGITLKNGTSEIFVCFAECAKNFAGEFSKEASRCVAARDITKRTFIFYTDPKVRLVFKKCFLKGLFTKRALAKKFLELQTAINRYGYTTYDLS